jgi:spore coat protein U-like protein
MKRLLLALALVLLSAAQARAQCSVSAGPMSFGNYDGGQGSTGVSTLHVSCFSLSNTTIQVSVTQTAALPALSTLLGQQLAYGLYLDPAYSQPWQLATPLSGQIQVPAGQSRSLDFTVYGKAPAHQQAVIGAYSASMFVVLNYQ